MKKSFILLSFLVLLLLPIISALQINMNTNLSQGQTLIAQVTGNFLGPIQIQNVLLYNGHVRVSFIPYINDINNTYYIYGQLGQQIPGNYSLNLTGVSYIDPYGQVQNAGVSQAFVITNSTADFFVNPGFVDTSQNFYINATNLGNQSIAVNYNLQNSSTQTPPANAGFFASLFANSNANALTSSQTINIASGQTQGIPLQIENFTGIVSAVLSTPNTYYNIPVIIEVGATPGLGPGILLVQPTYINVSMSTNSNTTRYLYLSNSGGQNLTNISLTLSSNLLPYVSLLNNNVEVDANSSSVQIPMSITSYNTENYTIGYITINYGSVDTFATVQLNFSNAYVPPPSNASNNSMPFYTCVQLSGTICNDTSTCGGQTQTAVDGACCLGTCQPNQTSGSATGPIIGWTIIVVVVIVVAWFLLKRFRKAKRPFNLLEAAKIKK